MLIDNGCQEKTKYKYVTSQSGEYFDRNVNVRSSDSIRKFTQQYDPGFGSVMEWKRGNDARIFFILHEAD